MALARVPSCCCWTASDRALLHRIARGMIRAGIWRSVENIDGESAGSFVRICCPERTEPILELSRAPDGRYVLVDRRSDTVSFHGCLAAALAQVAFVP